MDTDPGYLVIWGALATGFSFNFVQIFLRYGSIKEYQSFQEIIKGCLWGGLIKGYCFIFFLMGFLVWWLGKKFDGEGTVHEVRAGLVWSYLPTMFATLLTLVVCLNLGFQTLKPPPENLQKEGHSLRDTALDWSGLRGLQPVHILISRDTLTPNGLKLPFREPLSASSPLFWCTFALVIGGIWSTLLMIGTISETLRIPMGRAIGVLLSVSALCCLTFLIGVLLSKFVLMAWLGCFYWYCDKEGGAE